MTFKSEICLVVFSFFQFSACNPAEKSKKEGNESESVVVDNKTVKDNMPTNYKWDIVAKGTQCAVQSPKQVLLKNQAEFDELWKKSFEGIDINTQKPSINFTEKWVIAAFLGKVNTGGYGIDIKEIKANDAEKMVFIIHTKPGAGCMTTTAEESPFLIATIDHLSSGKIGFTIINEEKKCE